MFPNPNIFNKNSDRGGVFYKARGRRLKILDTMLEDTKGTKYIRDVLCTKVKNILYFEPRVVGKDGRKNIREYLIDLIIVLRQQRAPK
jgi:hypothetical protein